ncbi:hypothetical protein [Tissierella sp. Yu-01]|uniref:hypothetical protein n=1 Tax=Tissierella sp. Yu-01 TaxID=3035694 RepID=UPI00240DACA7|nr:hypothetical protein [Tissierella sp. Yu-01]WFA09833.1 hypothetical protein P3962_04520 [Tissierella sp. Yu-01]
MEFFITILVMLLITSILGYIFVVLKEKFYLKNNIILIDNKYVTQEDLDVTDLKEFFLDGTRLKAGDEIKVVTKDKESFIGILIGAVKKENSILLVTYKNRVLKFRIDNIMQFKIVSKYGKFFAK